VFPTRFREAAVIVAQFSDEPIDEYRAFVDEFVASVDRLPEHMASGGTEPLEIEMVLRLTLSDDLVQAFGRELDHIADG
jgi:hypothetical protein